MKKRNTFRISLFAITAMLFAVVILPLYFLGFGLYQWGYRMTTQELTQSIQTRADFFTNTLETELQRIWKLYQECLNDSDVYYYVNALSIMEKKETFSSLLRIEHRMKLLHGSSSYIDNVVLWMPRSDQMISSTRGIEKLKGEWGELLDAPMITTSMGLSVYNDTLYFTAPYPVIDFKDKPPLYVLSIEISNEKIIENLTRINTYSDGGTLLLVPNHNFSLLMGEDIGLTGKEILMEDMDIPGLYEQERKEEYLLVYVNSEILNMRTLTYVSKKIVYQGLDTYRNLFVVFTVAACILMLVYFWFSRRLISEPVRRLVDSLKKVERGHLDVRIDYRINDEFSYLYTTFNQMVESLENMYEVNYRQELLTQEAQLRQLQSQINPHFLHNSFFILYRMAKDEDYENISEFLTYLSDYYRYITRNARMEVEMREEDSHAKRYIQIQLVRFKKRISADIQPLPEKFQNLIVPRLILQPLLENAFQHGLKDVTQDGVLRMWYEEEEEYFLVHIEDNGAGMEPLQLEELKSKLSDIDNHSIERTGIINIHQRLKIRFGKRCGIRIERTEEGFTRITVVLDKGENNV